jgi:transposase
MTPPPHRYATGLTDGEWALLAPLIPTPKPGGRPAVHDRVLHVFYSCSRGSSRSAASAVAARRRATLQRLQVVPAGTSVGKEPGRSMRDGYAQGPPG